MQPENRHRRHPPTRNYKCDKALAAVVNGVIGIACFGGAALIDVLRSARDEGGQRGLGLLLFLAILFALGGLGFLAFALVQMFTRLRVYDKGLVWHRYGKKRIILWPAVQSFSRGDSEASHLNLWSMVLHSGERIDFHSVLYRHSEFEETMKRIAEQIEEAQKEFA